MTKTIKNEGSLIKIYFNPVTVGEKRHFIRLQKLNQHRRRGDWEKVASKLQIASNLAQKSFVRVYSKHHLDVVRTLEEIIEERINLLKPLL